MQTYAQYLRKEGHREGHKEGRKEGQVLARRQILLSQLSERFGELPPDVVTAVESTSNIKRLDTWLKRTVKVETLDEVQIT